MAPKKQITSPADDVSHITDALLEDNERTDTVYTCSNGLKLQIKKINGRIFVDANAKIPVPKVPTTFIKEKDREEENPNHPDYLRALQEYSYAQEELAFNISFALGVSVLEIPEGMQPIESPEWSDEIKEAWDLSGVNITIPPTGNLRKVAWLKYYAMPMEDDQVEVLTRVMSMGGGVVAAKVDEAIAGFRSPEERLADHGIRVIE